MPDVALVTRGKRAVGFQRAVILAELLMALRGGVEHRGIAVRLSRLDDTLILASLEQLLHLRGVLRECGRCRERQHNRKQDVLHDLIVRLCLPQCRRLNERSFRSILPNPKSARHAMLCFHHTGRSRLIFSGAISMPSEMIGHAGFSTAISIERVQ